MHPQLAAALERARTNPDYGFDTLRDELAALPEEVLPELLAVGLDPDASDVLGQVVAALGDTRWPGAYEAFVVWVSGTDAWVAVDAGCALDAAGGGGFGFWSRVAPEDQPDPERVARVAPELVDWWENTGRASAPDLETWRENLGRPPTREERIYALVRSTPFAVLADGRAVQTEGPLPRDTGVHHTGGVAVIEGAGEIPVAYVLDSGAEEPIAAVMAESRQGWINIKARVDAHRPRHTIGDPEPGALESRYEVGPTGSLRDRASS